MLKQKGPQWACLWVLIFYATSTFNHTIFAPTGSSVAPSCKRGPEYCPKIADSPCDNSTVWRFVSTFKPSKFENTAAVSAWQQAVYCHSAH